MAVITNQNTVAEVEKRCQEWLHAPTKPAFMVAEVKALRDSRTHQIHVRGALGIAPDNNTIILWPVQVSRWGYWNKAQIRKQIADVKRELLAEMAQRGYKKELLTEPFRVCPIDF